MHITEYIMTEEKKKFDLECDTELRFEVEADGQVEMEVRNMVFC